MPKKILKKIDFSLELRTITHCKNAHTSPFCKMTPFCAVSRLSFEKTNKLHLFLFDILLLISQKSCNVSLKKIPQIYIVVVFIKILLVTVQSLKLQITQKKKKRKSVSFTLFHRNEIFYY